MHSQFDMTVMGLLHFFLGLEILHHAQGIFVSQQGYVQGYLHVQEVDWLSHLIAQY